MDNQYLQELINEAKSRGGGLLLNLEGQPAAVVLTIENYNKLASKSDNPNAGVVLSQQELKAATSRIQKVLVTGGAGYIGGHLVRELVKAGHEVVVLDNLSTGLRENVDPKAVLAEGDLANEGFLQELFSAHKFDAVFHMAASLEVEESVSQPLRYFENNHLNTVKLLMAMNAVGCRKIIFSSTAAVYGEPTQNPITENASLRPSNPYGSSKLLAERAIKYFCEYLNFSAVVFRYFNACGFDPQANILPTHQSHLIYKVMEVASGKRQVLEVFGNNYKTFDGTCIRDYVHVLDIVLPHILALQKMASAGAYEVYNIGTSRGQSVAEVANAASELLNKIIPMEVGPRRPGDPPETVADNHKLLEELGYQMKYSSLENILQSSWKVMNRL